MILAARKKEKIQTTLPAEFVGMWTADGGLYEFRANGRYYIHGTRPYELRDLGQTLFYGSEYSRKSGDPADVFGVWDLKPDGEEELTFDKTVHIHHIGMTGIILVNFRTILRADC